MGLVPVLLASCLFGPVGGAIAGAVSAGPTLVLWGHPWAWFGAVFEGAVVGWLTRRVRPIVADALYWIGGAFYLYASYVVISDFATSVFTTVLIKQIVNGLLAALVVQVALTVPAIRLKLMDRLPRPLVDVPVRTVFATILALGATIPLLWVSAHEGKARQTVEHDRLNAQNLFAAHNIATQVEQTLGLGLRDAKVLAEEFAQHAKETGQLPEAASIQAHLERLVEHSPELLDAYVGDANGRAVAFYPPTGPRGDPLIGMDFSDREYFQRLKTTHAPIISNVFVGRGGTYGPLVIAAAPIVAPEFKGYVLNAFNLSRLTASLSKELGPDQRMIILDKELGVVVDSMFPGREDIIVEKGSPLEAALKVVGDGGTGAYVPEPRHLPLQRERVRRQFARVVVPQLSWSVIVEQSSLKLQEEVERSYLALLLTLMMGLGISGVATIILGQLVVAPIGHITDVAARLARGDRGARTGSIPAGGPREIRALGHSFDRMADDIAAQLDAIERASRTKDEFLSVASHELKTPLTSLKSQVQLLQRAKDANAHRLERINRQVDRVTRLVDQLLDVSQLGSRRLALQLTTLDLAPLVEHIAQEFVAAAPLHTIELDVVSVSGQWDETRLEQVIYNLISNAIKYSPRGGPVTVTLRQEPPGFVTLSVSDRGVGLKGGAVSFERFDRGAATDLSGVSGLGVGLYISREIVHRHGGQISLSGRDGGGAVATVRLPLSPPEESPGSRAHE